MCIDQQNHTIATLLWYGTCMASALIAGGLLIEFTHLSPRFLFDITGSGIVNIGIALFILLPIARVGLMLALFLSKRDYVYTAISAFVFIIIGVGFFIAS